MSFRWFIYFSALCGAWAALAGWFLGRVLSPESPVGQAAVKGLFLGLLVALALGLVDSVWNVPSRLWSQFGARVGTAAAVGCAGGLLGATVGQLFYGWTEWGLFLVLGWVVTGLLIGTSVGFFEWLACRARRESTAQSRRKLFNGLAGGAVGGLAGGLLSLIFRGIWKGLFGDKPEGALWSPSAIGFVALGACIGLMVGLAQVVLRQAWIRVEAGFRVGREMILTKDETTIGRAESCDLGLFGDPGVERSHARILRQGQGYVLADAGTPGGTFLNDSAIAQPTLLRSGDLIRVGRCVLRFGEKQQSAAGK